MRTGWVCGELGERSHVAICDAEVCETVTNDIARSFCVCVCSCFLFHPVVDISRVEVASVGHVVHDDDEKLKNTESRNRYNCIRQGTERVLNRATNTGCDSVVRVRVRAIKLTAVYSKPLVWLFAVV